TNHFVLFVSLLRIFIGGNSSLICFRRQVGLSPSNNDQPNIKPNHEPISKRGALPPFLFLVIFSASIGLTLAGGKLAADGLGDFSASNILAGAIRIAVGIGIQLAALCVIFIGYDRLNR